jgi:peptidoglycan/xylan/chitin deacetylase (PgdA/CDA1 family)
VHLLVGIDTEGDNQWSAEARRNQRFENIYALPRLHALFARHAVRPTYVITYPVAKDARSADTLRALRDGGDCEIGAHHHAWETPPCSDEDIRRHPYASMLPRAQFEAQLEQLTEAIGASVGRPPVSYRSGRFGFSARHVAALERCGYLVESSVAPLFYETHKGGPEFVEAPLKPYFLA